MGQAIITAKSNNGISGTCNITVSESASDISSRLAVYLEAGEKTRLCVTDDIDDNSSFIWSSDDSSVATVNMEGVVTGVSAGICNITAQDASGFKQTLAVRVVDTNPVVEPDPEPEIIKVNDNDANIKYSGTWLPYSGDSRFYDGDEYYSNEVNAYAEFSFRGTTIRWIAATNSDNGKCDIYVDGVLEVQGLDLYSANIETQKVLFSKSGLSRGEHTIKIVVTGEKNANATDCYVTVDAFEYEA